MSTIALVGGFDSQIMALKLKQSVPDLICVHFDSFSNSKAETKTALVDMDVVNLPLMPKTNDPVPVLNGRDLIMCSYVAMVYQAETIFLGMLPEDLHSFPDLSVDYAHSLSRMLSQTHQRQILVKYYFVERGLHKLDVAELGESLNIDSSKLVTCFHIDDEGKGCGQCRKCVGRWAIDKYLGREPFTPVSNKRLEQAIEDGTASWTEKMINRHLESDIA